MNSRLVQTRLGRSDMGRLKLVNTAPPCPASTPSLILQLPTELLQRCIHMVRDMDIRLSKDSLYHHEYYYGEADANDASHESDQEDLTHSPEARTRIHIEYAAMYALSLTCKRFHALATPMLYARPRFDSGHYENDRSSQCDKFYNTVRQNSELRPFVKHLALQETGFLYAFEQTCLMFPNLESLLLVCPWGDDEDDPAEPPSPEEEGTASLTELRLRNIGARPQDVKHFLKRPRRLNIFALDDVTYDGYDWDYTHPNPAFRWSHSILADVLSPQRYNLQVLELGWMGYTPGQNQFDISLYPSLHTLQLCIAYEAPNAAACQNWLTPALRTIILDLGLNDSRGGKGSGFSVCESDEVTRFTKLAGAEKKRRPESVGLQEIGFVAHHIGDYTWSGDEEWLCNHGGGWDKAAIFEALKNIEAHGFSAVWIGASGTKHSVKMFQEACPICAGATQKF